MTMRIARACLLLLSALSCACAQTQEATSDARITETAVAAAAAKPAEATAAAETPAEPTEPTSPAASKKKDRACEETYVNSRLPRKTCTK